MKRKIVLFIIFLFVLTLSACDRKNDNKVVGQEEAKIYYIDNNATKIVSQKYSPKSTTREELVEEYLNALRTEPEIVGYRKAMPDNISIKEYYFSGEDELSINFDSSYNELKGIPEVLCRATIVKTLSQIEGLEYIYFYINGLPLKDSNEKIIGLSTASDFISSTGAETNFQISLYFSNQDGTTLIESNKNIYYTDTGSMEEQIIKQLISGPTEIGLIDTIPDGTTLLNVTTKEGICYVDFNEKFLDKVPSISDEVAIYSVVNSLVELPSINKVQFLINGDIRKTYRESIAFDGFFERNLSLIEGSK